jgi:hypothetical protein
VGLLPEFLRALPTSCVSRCQTSFASHIDRSASGPPQLPRGLTDHVDGAHVESIEVPQPVGQPMRRWRLTDVGRAWYEQA